MNVTPAGRAPEEEAVGVATVTPSYLMVTVEAAAKLDPVTVTVDPTTPLAGLRAIVGAGTVNVAVAVLVPSLAVTE